MELNLSKTLLMSMNYYIRYFNDEVLVHTVEEALAFIRTIPGLAVTPQFESDFRQYAESSMPYPKRYKVRARVYFIVIKTTAATIEEFKQHGKNAEQPAEEVQDTPMIRYREQVKMRLADERPGWYEGMITFKRVVPARQTGKFDYCDTTFTARVKAHSAQECYDRIITYLQERNDIDRRSQFPSAKGKNFQFKYLGLKPLSELTV